MSIDAKDIVRIINACKRSGVESIKLGDLEIKFAPGEAAQTLVVTGEAGPTPTDDELKDAQELSDTKTVLDRADEELALMQVENPALFEELLVNRELEGRAEREDETVFD